MTTPAGPGISGDDVVAELRTVNPGRASAMSLSDPDVLALAGVTGPACSFSQLCGKTASGGGGGGSIVVTAPDCSARRFSTTVGPVTATCTAGATGGSGGYTYSWAYVSGDVMTLGGAGSSCTFTHSVGEFSDLNAVYRCTATDSLGATGFQDLNVELLGASA